MRAGLSWLLKVSDDSGGDFAYQQVFPVRNETCHYSVDQICSGRFRLNTYRLW